MRKKLTNKYNLLVLGILLLAAFFRLYRIADYQTFLGDEGRDVIVAFNILHGHFTLLGPTASVGGFFLGPIYYYFMAPFLLLFNYNPVGPAVMVALFGIFTAWFVYKTGTEFFGRTAGLVAALFYAISPIVIIYSHSSWNPNLMPPFSIVTLYLVYKAVKEKKMWLFAVCGVLYGILMQLHYIEVFVGVIIVVYLFLSRLNLGQGLNLKNARALAKEYLSFVFGFLIGFSPFLAFEARHGFPNIKSVFSFILHPAEGGSTGNSFIGTVIDVFFRLFGRLVAAYPIQDKLDKQLFAHIAFWNVSIWVLTLIATGIFLFQCFKTLKRIQKEKSLSTKFLQQLLIFLWIFFGVMLFGFYKKEIHDYYFEFMFPLPFLLVGNAFLFFWKKAVYWKAFAAASLFALIAVNLFWNPLRFPANKLVEQVKDISAFVLSKTDSKPYNFALMSTGNSDHAYRYFFFIWGHPPVTMENLLNDPSRKTVTDQLLLICELPDCKPLGYPLFEVSNFGRAEIAGEWKTGYVKVFKLVHYKGK